MTVTLNRSDLYSSPWTGADELRGGVGASQYKHYVLTVLSVKYVSDKAEADPNSLVGVPNGGSFDNLVSYRGQGDTGAKVKRAIRKLADANDLNGAPLAEEAWT